MNPSLTLNLLGGVQLLNYDVPLALPKSRKALALFIYLAYTERAYTREALADLLWDTTSTAQSLSNLRTLLTRFPASMAAYLSITRDTIAINPKGIVSVDACAFTNTMNTLPQPLSHSAAVTCAGLLASYRGDFLDGFHVTGAPRWHEWMMLEREYLHALALDGYQQLTAYYLACGDYAAGIEVATALLRLDPANEIGHGHLMRMLAFTGQRTAALAQFEACRQLFQDEFGVDPDDALQRLYIQIRDGELAVPTATGAKRSTPRHNLPGEITPLIGQHAATIEVQMLLRRTDVRLVTLTGPGGVGKSRLGEAAAWALVNDFANGVFLVELAAVRDPELVLSAIAQTLGIRDQDSTPLQQRLHEHLREQQLLLLIDNFEQVIDAAPRLFNLLRTCPQVKLLVTSRETLRLHGEHEFVVPTLALRDAVELFVQRAQAVNPTFVLDANTVTTVKTICQQLDCLPLAIELAAVQSKLFSPAAILNRLKDRFSFLIARTRDRPDRQRTLRTTLDWSYELLTPEEQQLFRRLAVFLGGRSLVAVETICNPVDDSAVVPLTNDVLNGLTALLDQSLLYQTTDSAGEPRFMMLATIYEYAAAQLAGSEEADALRRRHLDYYVAMAEQAETELTGANQVIWLDRLDAELDNFRAALDYALLRGTIELGARLSAALRRFWGMRGHVSEGRQSLSDLLVRADQISPLTKAKVCSAAGTLAEAQSDYDQAVTLQQEALTLRRTHGDKTGVVVSLNNLGFLAENQGDYRTARSLYEETLTRSREIDYKLYIAISLINLGRLLHALGEYALARVYAEESLARNRAMDNQWGIALALDNVGNLALIAGEYPAARTYYEEALAIRRGFGGKWGIATSLQNLGEIDQRQGKYDAARRYYEESLALHKEIRDQSGIAGVLNSLGRLHHDLGDNTAAQALLQESLALYRAIGERAGIALALNELGWVSQSLGDLAGAQALHEEGMAMQRAVGQPLQLAVVLHYLATLARRQGDGVCAREYFQESLRIFRDLGAQYWIEQALRAIAPLFWQAEKIVVTAQLLGTAAAFRLLLAVPIPPREAAAYEQMLTAVQDGLGEEAFATAWAIGQAMPLEQAVAFALAELEILFRRSD